MKEPTGAPGAGRDEQGLRNAFSGPEGSKGQNEFLERREGSTGRRGGLAGTTVKRSRERAGAASVRLQSDDGARKNISFEKVGMTN